jgi:O-antigen ligase
VWALWEWLRTLGLSRRAFYGICGGAIGIAVLGLVISALNPNTSLGTVVTQVETSISTGQRTSQGERVEFYRKSLELFERRPLTGFGTGSLPTETQALAAGATTDLGRMTTRNPHNEFIMWAVQLGVPGLLTFLLFLAMILRRSLAARTTSAMMLRGTWLVFTTGCLVNSLLLDHLEGHAFVFAVGILLPL